MTYIITIDYLFRDPLKNTMIHYLHETLFDFALLLTSSAIGPIFGPAGVFVKGRRCVHHVTVESK